MLKSPKAIFIAALLFLTAALAVFWIYSIVSSTKRSALLQILKDPDSTKFRKESVEGDFICGEFNSKNGLGAYVGYKRYISSKTGYMIEGDSHRTLFPDLPDSAPFLEQAQVSIKAIEIQTIRLERDNEARSAGNRPTETELNTYAFSWAWSKYC